MERAVLRLAGFGHRRIGFINGLSHYMYASLRRAGFCRGLEKAGLFVDEDLIRDGAIDKQHGEQEGAILLDLSEPPTAIICALDMAALGVYRAAEARGLVVGADLSIIGYDGLPEGEFATPPLTSFSVDNRQAGECLADLLIKRIRGEAPETLRQLGEATLVARASDGPPTVQ